MNHHAPLERNHPLHAVLLVMYRARGVIGRVPYGWRFCILWCVSRSIAAATMRDCWMSRNGEKVDASTVMAVGGYRM